MIIKKYNCLPDEARCVRETVFVKEQGFQEEFDSIDKISTHLVMFDGDKPVAACRFFWDSNADSFILGRLAVIKEYRGKHLGTELVKEAERIIKADAGKALSLHAQCRVKAFYAKQGYSEFGKIDYDEDCPHIWMKKFL